MGFFNSGERGQIGRLRGVHGGVGRGYLYNFYALTTLGTGLYGFGVPITRGVPGGVVGLLSYGTGLVFFGVYNGVLYRNIYLEGCPLVLGYGLEKRTQVLVVITRVRGRGSYNVPGLVYGISQDLGLVIQGTRVISKQVAYYGDGSRHIYTMFICGLGQVCTITR